MIRFSPCAVSVPIAWLCLVIVLAIASPGLAIDNIRVSYATLSAAYMDHICAMDKGYFREEGLNIEVIRAPGGVATPGLLSGQFQFSSSASSRRFSISKKWGSIRRRFCLSPWEETKYAFPR